MPKYTASRRIEFDAGHRVPDHESKCHNPHGHRYAVEVFVTAETVQREGSGSSAGMVTDFGYVKRILMEEVHDVLDHGFILYEGDKSFDGALYDPVTGKRTNDWKIVWFSYTPTAENIARWVWEQCYEPIADLSVPELNHFVELEAVKVYETPNAFAIYQGDIDND